MENMRKRMKVRVASNEKDFVKYASRPTYINHNIYDKNFVVIHEKKELLALNKPIYIGCVVLELSKLAMYEFYYDFLIQKCENVKLLYMDTDSFIIEVIGEHFDDIMLENKEYFDLSNSPKNSKYHTDDNQNVPGKMKYEYGGKVIYEFVRAKPKSYTIIDVNNCEKSVHKGYSLNFKSSEFKDVINNGKVVRHSMKKIISKNHKIYTQDGNKISQSCFDNKRHNKDDGINTLAFGHRDRPNNI